MEAGLLGEQAGLSAVAFAAMTESAAAAQKLQTALSAEPEQRMVRCACSEPGKVDAEVRLGMRYRESDRMVTRSS